MSYIVVYLRADGSSGVEECADLDLAVVAAERLRNVDSVERPRIFKTEEVTYDFKPYYRVEVTSAQVSGAAAPVAPIPTVAEESADAQIDVAEPAAEVVDVPGETSVVEQPPTPSVAPDTAEVSDAASDKGLFGDTDTAPVVDTPDTTDATALVEDVKDNVPPRRGLFGR